MQPAKAIQSFHVLGDEIRSFLSGNSSQSKEWEEILQVAEQENSWFSQKSIRAALEGISLWLYEDKLSAWLSSYPGMEKRNKKPLIIGVIMAGNIPLAGFHDFLCVLLSGYILYSKLSHSDSKLLPFIAGKLIAIEPEWKNKIHFVEKLNGSSLNAVIATGSNNTARHFEYYFKNIPHIIRKNRNGVAIIDGNETTDELSALGKDIFSYFGLGCRNISKLYVPVNYNFDNFFKSIEPYKEVIHHNKYHSNYIYNRTIYLMDGKKFTDNGFLAVINNPASSSPIAVLHFEEYKDIKSLVVHLSEIAEQIQCIATSIRMKNVLVKHHLSSSCVIMGETQSPSLADYADGVDTMKFLCSL